MQINRGRDSLIDIEYLTQLQDSFSRAVGVYTYCLDSAGVPVTEASGPKEDAERLMEYISPERVADIFYRLTLSNIEDQVIEDTQIPNVKFGLTTVRVNGQALLTWVVFGVISDYDPEGYVEEPITGISSEVTFDRFQDGLDLIRETCLYQTRVRMHAVNAEAENRRNKYSEQELNEALKRSEVMTSIVQLMDKDEIAESIAVSALKIVGEYLGLSSSHIYITNIHDNSLMDIMAEWYAPGMVPRFDTSRDLPRYSFLSGSKLQAISSGSTVINPKWLEEMEMLGIKSMVIVPIKSSDRPAYMYACYDECNRDRYWSVDEINFLSDATRIVESIIERRRYEINIASSFESVRASLDNVGTSVYVRDLQTGTLQFTNKTMITNFTSEVKFDKSEDRPLKRIFESQIPEDSDSGSLEIYNPQRDEYYELYYSHIIWMGSAPSLMCAILDVTEKKKNQKKIEQLAYTDFLTGLYNRMCCERDLARLVDGAVTENKHGAILYLDLDDFKHINDGLGHQYGDVLLQAIAHSFTRVRGVEETSYRMGGDEFVIVVPPDSYSDLDRIITDIKAIFNRPWFLKDADYYCTMSMGVVSFPDEGTQIQDLIKKADITMYEAKKSGKNKVAIYNRDMDSQSSKRLDMEKNMREAGKNGYEEFLVYYQPIMDIQLDGSPCVGAEALVRWDSPSLGFISPGDFIPLAEYLGLIIPIGAHVLRKACETCKKWNDNGHPNYKVNVNLSVVQLVQPDIVQIVRTTVEETGINPHNLTLEVTESLAINDMNKMKEVLAAIREIGCRIALDDFGTGYSSLNHIRELPIDVIKVDQSFVRELASDAYSQAFVRYISQLASMIGMSICVEGIETSQQFEVLSDMDVRMVQGYYFSRPLPQNKFEEKYI
ncbi:MAG: EAL domain-containing protein [Lachnospiraceae bacterium]|nr:EAL domain-containing protein [Lachnospiraceae bacterium]